MKITNPRKAGAALIAVLMSATLVLDAAAPAFAGTRAKSRSSVNSHRGGAKAGNRNVSGNRNVNNNRNQNVNVNRNKNVNVNSNRNVNVNVDVDHHGGYYGGGYYNSGCCYHDDFHPVATIATAAVTAAVVGSIVSSIPSSGCQSVIVNGIGYQQCGSTWYQPQMSGSTTNYVVVNPPR